MSFTIIHGDNNKLAIKDKETDYIYIPVVWHRQHLMRNENVHRPHSQKQKHTSAALSRFVCEYLPRLIRKDSKTCTFVSLEYAIEVFPQDQWLKSLMETDGGRLSPSQQEPPRKRRYPSSPPTPSNDANEDDNKHQKVSLETLELMMRRVVSEELDKRLSDAYMEKQRPKWDAALADHFDAQCQHIKDQLLATTTKASD